MRARPTHLHELMQIFLQYDGEGLHFSCLGGFGGFCCVSHSRHRGKHSSASSIQGGAHALSALAVPRGAVCLPHGVLQYGSPRGQHCGTDCVAGGGSHSAGCVCPGVQKFSTRRRVAAAAKHAGISVLRLEASEFSYSRSLAGCAQDDSLMSCLFVDLSRACNW